MNTWICRVLAVIFFINTLPTEAFARKKSSRVDEQKVTQRAYEEQNKAKKYSTDMTEAELREYLKQKDISPRERAYAELELQGVQAFDRYADSLSSGNFYPKGQKGSSVTYGRLTREEADKIYYSEISAIQDKQNLLESREQLTNFYQLAQSTKSVQNVVYALRKQGEKEKLLAKRVQDQTTQQKEKEAREKQLRNGAPMPVDSPSAYAKPARPLPGATPVDVLKLWEEGEITIEDLVEYMDPGLLSDTTSDPRAIADAARLLWYYFISYNNPSEQLDSETTENAVWLALRLKYRAIYQLSKLEKEANRGQANWYVQARGNIMLLLTQVSSFLNKHYKYSEAQDKYDKQLPQYELVYNELNEQQTQDFWNYSDVKKAILKSVKDVINQDSAEHQLLADNISFLTTYLISEGDTHNLALLLAAIDKDGETYHGSNEGYVSSLFASLYNTLLMLPTTRQTQEKLRALLTCAAAPKCNYEGTGSRTNAVNVRVEALAVASMLRQDTQVNLRGKKAEINTQYLDKNLFSDAAFREQMGRYTVDVYYPTVQFHATKDSFDLPSVKTYGLEVDGELVNLSNHLSGIFETFLPLKEPKSSDWKTVKGDDNPLKGCHYRVVDTNQSAMINLTSFDSVKGGTLAPSKSEKGVPCDQHAMGAYSHAGTLLVVASDGKIREMAAKGFNPSNKNLATNAFAEDVVKEVVMWYIWGAVAKGFGFLWKGVKTFFIATKAAKHARAGMRLARFESKFSQVWKFQTNTWKNEWGIVKIVKSKAENGEVVYYIEVARPGYQGYSFEFLGKEFNPNTLKGRIRLRNAVARQGRAKGLSVMTKAEQKAVAAEQKIVQAVEKDVNKAIRQAGEGDGVVYRPGGAVPNEPVYVEIASGNAVVGEANALGGTLLSDQTALSTTIGRGSEFPRLVSLRSLGQASEGVTGNIIGANSGRYYGTLITPLNQNLAAYHVASGLMNHGAAGTLGPGFAYRLIGKQFPVLGTFKGYLNFVLGLKAADMPAYYLYVKPMREKFEKEQDEKYTKETGLKELTPEEKANAPQPTVLDQVQNLRPQGDDTRWAAMTTAFMLANDGAHLLLTGMDKIFNSDVAPSVRQTRQQIYKTMSDYRTKVASMLPDNLSETAKEYMMIPLDVAMMPAMLIGGDPHPDYSEAEYLRYVDSAKAQQIDQALEGHSVVDFTKEVEEEIKGISEDKSVLKGFKKTMPEIEKYNKEIDKIYSEYQKVLEEAKKLAAPDTLDKAQAMMKKAGAKFVTAKNELLSKVIKENTDNSIPVAIKNVSDQFTASYGAYFTPEDAQKLKESIEAYYGALALSLMKFYIENAPETAQREINEYDRILDKQIKGVEQGILERLKEAFVKIRKSEEREIPLVRDQFIRTNREALNYLPKGTVLTLLDENKKEMKLTGNGKELITALYKWYGDLAKKASTDVEKDVAGTIEHFMDVEGIFDENQLRIMTAAVQARVSKKKEEIAREINNERIPASVKAALTDLYDDYYNQLGALQVQFYSAKKEASLNRGAQTEEELESIAITKIQVLDGLMNTAITQVSRGTPYSKALLELTAK